MPLATGTGVGVSLAWLHGAGGGASLSGSLALLVFLKYWLDDLGLLSSGDPVDTLVSVRDTTSSITDSNYALHYGAL